VSIDATVARVSELAKLLTFAPALAAIAAAPAPATATAGATSAPFSTQLASALSPMTASSGTDATGLTGAIGATGATGATPYAAEISAAAARNGIDPNLLTGLIRAESNFDPNAGSPAGAQGLTQLMPGTAAGLGVSNPLDPVQSIEGGARYLRQQLDRFGGDVTKALAAYNAGPGAVERFGGVPPYEETQNYVRRVLGYAQGTIS
jgi:soluble lytic murein transglycosylase-like protein